MTPADMNNDSDISASVAEISESFFMSAGITQITTISRNVYENRLEPQPEHERYTLQSPVPQ